MVIKRDSYYVITNKFSFDSILLQGIFLMEYAGGPYQPEEGELRKSVDYKYYIKLATLAEIALYAKPLVDKI